jgi:hypothetical protein
MWKMGGNRGGWGIQKKKISKKNYINKIEQRKNLYQIDFLKFS